MYITLLGLVQDRASVPCFQYQSIHPRCRHFRRHTTPGLGLMRAWYRPLAQESPVVQVLYYRRTHLAYLWISLDVGSGHLRDATRAGVCETVQRSIMNFVDIWAWGEPKMSGSGGQCMTINTLFISPGTWAHSTAKNNIEGEYIRKK